MDPIEGRLRPDPSVSVAIPLYNEIDSVAELIARVDAVLDETPRSSEHEIVCVDDGSFDGTLPALLSLQEQYGRLKVVSLSRNFGHQAAVTAALDHTQGEVVLVMDGDLQDRPEALARFLAEYKDGADVVFARRVARPEGFFLRLAYRSHYRLLAAISDDPVQMDSGDFGLLSRKAVDLVRSLPERQRYVRGLRAWIGLNQVGIDVERDERFAGESKYSFSGLLGLAFEGVFAFSRVPLRVATFLGLGTVLVGAGFGLFVLIDRLAGGGPQGFASLAILQIVFAGVLLLVLGVVGEYVGRIYDEVKRRPIYVVQSVSERSMD